MALVKVSEPDPGVGLIVIDSPPMNFGTNELYGEIEEGLIALRDGGSRVVVVASAVDGYFIAHGHVGALLGTLAGVGELPTGDPMARIRAHKELDTGSMVSIAAVDGQAWGGGFETALACNLRVVSETATVGQPEVRVGVPTLDGAARIAHLVGEAAAMRLILDGRPIDGIEAHRLGLAHRLVPAGEARGAALEWARWLASHPPWALVVSKDLIVGARALTLRDALRRETALFVGAFTQPRVVERGLEVQGRYDAGGDSYDAFEIPRD